jgi:hypothetical protein
MIEELQRSVMFSSRANGTLKQQNDKLSRLLMQAQNQAAAVDSTAPRSSWQSKVSRASVPLLLKLSSRLKAIKRPTAFNKLRPRLLRLRPCLRVRAFLQLLHVRLLRP